ncbi:MAG TPA: alpha/beta hydrolase [Pseudonocardiaceae bacterium]|jgi:pimeloyl-ACP methyl ester carboxylesterase|nr:alpha/beta hydrolase [Pseudonocardiaceae bacterium]
MRSTKKLSTRKISVAAAAAGAIALAGLAVSGVSASAAPTHAATTAATTGTSVADHHQRPTIVLLSGAFEGGNSWDGVTSRLQRTGYPVVVPALPLRGLASDTAYVTSLLAGVQGPVVLAGHSYGGQVATEVAAADPNVKAVVYAAAFIPVKGESAEQLDSQFPGSLLGTSTYTQAFPGGTDVYVKPDAFRALFAEDSSASESAVAAADQRPITTDALTEPAASGLPAGVASYAIVATNDMAIPPAAERFMAQRAGARIFQVSSSHDLPTSHPGPVATIIEKAASAF